MFRVIAFLFLFLVLITTFTPAYAEIITTRPIRNNSFNSKLKLNQPKTIYTAPITSSRQNRLHPTYCPNCYHHNPYLSEADLTALEKYALNKTYRRNSDLERLERLENLAFGAVQTGDVYSRFKNVENIILSRPKQDAKQSLLNNITNYFAGQTTGFTPNLIQYPTYNNLGGFSSNPYLFTPNSSYGNTNYEQYSNGIFGRGWGMSGQNYGTGSSIRILD